MYHISANLAFGRREKNIWGYKKLQGGKKPIRKTEKKVATFFFFLFFFGDSKKFVGAAKMSRGHQMVTLRHCPGLCSLFARAKMPYRRLADDVVEIFVLLHTSFFSLSVVQPLRASNYARFYGYNSKHLQSYFFDYGVD